MANRRPIYRKEKPRSFSKTGLVLCLLLAVGTMVVPIGSDLVRNAKAKVRDLALGSGLIDFSDCVVTPQRALACDSRAVGMPLPAALRLMEDSQALAADQQRQREKAENEKRDLALKVDQLRAQLRQAQLAANASSFFPPNGEVRPTGLTVANPSGMTSTPGEPQQSDAMTPPDEE
jgi:hypothetical protein